MRVVHVSTHDVAGGAARAALRIHEGLRRIGLDSSMMVAVRGGDDPDVRQAPIDRRMAARLHRRWLRSRVATDRAPYEHTAPPGHERFSDDRTPLGLDLIRNLPSADLVHLHYVADFLDYREFFDALPPSTALVWSLHDMNPFTGGCHYDDGCGGFTGSCGACPQLGSGDEADLSRQVWSRKEMALASVRSRRMHVVADSRWMEDEARRSSLFSRFPISTIHYGLDTDVFAPSDRRRARKELGVGEGSRVVLFVADSVENRRKGFDRLLGALDRLPPGIGAHLVSIGSGRPEVPPTLPHLHLDRIDDDRRLAAIYGAADLFVIPSLQEAYGQTALEAMACGTPSIGFDIGGIRDVIREGETGTLVPPAEPEALAAGMMRLLSDPAGLLAMRASCRAIALREHTLVCQAEQYRGVYESLLKAWSPQAAPQIEPWQARQGRGR